MLADEATNDVSGEEKSAEKDIETTAIDESKEEATEERIETSEEKTSVEEEDGKSERDGDEQSDQVESAEISTAQKGIDIFEMKRVE